MHIKPENVYVLALQRAVLVVSVIVMYVFNFKVLCVFSLKKNVNVEPSMSMCTYVHYARYAFV